MLSDTNRRRLSQSSDSSTSISKENTSRGTSSPLCVKFSTPLTGRRWLRLRSESDNSNLRNALPGLTFLLDPEGKIGISSNDATEDEAGPEKARNGNVPKKNSAEELNGAEDNNKRESDVEVVHQLVPRRMATGVGAQDIENIVMAETPHPVATPPLESVAKLRWKTAARQIKDKQNMWQQQDGYPDKVHEELETFDAGAENTEGNEVRSRTGEAAWSRLLKKLHDEKLLILEKSNLFGETIRGHSKGIRAKGKVATEALREKSQSASRIVKERSVIASKAVKDRSNSATRGVRSVSSSSKKSLRSRSPRQKCEAVEADATLNKEGRQFFAVCSESKTSLNHYRAGLSIGRKVLKVIFWEVPPAGGPLL